MREVRLTETIVDGLTIGTPPFAIEVYCHARSMVLDSYGCLELDDVELEAAVQLVLEAGRDVPNGLHRMPQMLQTSSEPWCWSASG
jgi:hypothetical protein